MLNKDQLHSIFQQILVVDDEENARVGLSKLLAAEGFHVRSAEDGCMALACLQEEHFNLVISDLNMPNLDGLEFLRTVQSDYPDVSVIILTAACGARSYLEAMNLGAAEYLCKPLNLESLKSVMQRLADRGTPLPQGS